MQENIKSSNFVLGVTSMTFANAVRMVVQIMILPIVGRILGPYAYGQVALVAPFVFFAMILAESGLGACIIRADKLSDELEGTVLCFSMGLSILIIILFAIISFPLGNFFHEPLFPYLLLGMSSILLLAALNIVPAALLIRSKNYGWIALSDIVSSLGGVVAVIIGIILGFGVWSIVLQQVVFWVLKVSVVMIGVRYRPHFIFHRSIIIENMRFGMNLMGASILTFLSKNIDNLLIGAFLGIGELGYYALAFQIVSIPSMLISSSLYFPLFSATKESFRENKLPVVQFLRITKVGLLISAPFLMGIAVTSPLIVPLILGEKWLPMIPLIFLLTIFGLTQTIITTTSAVIIGSGRSELTFRISIISALATISAITLGSFINSSAVAFGVSLASIFVAYFALLAVAKICDIEFSDIYKKFTAPLVSTCLMGGVVGLFQWFLPDNIHILFKFIFSVAIGVFVYVFTLLIFFREHIAEDIGEIKAIMRIKSF